MIRHSELSEESKLRSFVALLLRMTMCSMFLYSNALASGNEPVSANHQVYSSEEKAKLALESLRVAYTEKNSEHFFHYIHEQTYFSYNDLKRNVSQHLFDTSQIELLIFTDHVLTNKDKVDIKTHWQRRHVNNHSGAVEKNEGQAEFLFKINEDDAYLIDIHGDNPF